jgi:NTP pyrophosphatase (non-canonical NTP hydrolase)
MKQPINKVSSADVEAFCRDITISDAFRQYQTLAVRSAIYPGKGTPFGLMYAALGLAEAGEVQNKVKKAFRDDDILRLDYHEPSETIYVVDAKELTPERRAQIIKELGGVLWYVAAVCSEINASIAEVAAVNLRELASRAERGTLSGDGDNR